MLKQSEALASNHHAEKIRTLLMALIVLFPVLSIVIKGGGSAVYTLLLIFSLIYAWPQWLSLKQSEKNWLIASIVFFALGAISLFFSENIDEGWKRIERYFRLMSLGSIMLLLLRLRVRIGIAFIYGLAFSAVCLAGQAFYESIILDKWRVEGIYYAIGFGDMAVLVAALLSTAILTVVRDVKHRLLLVISVGLALYASIESIARGAWLFIPFAATLLGVLYWREMLTKTKWGLIGLLVTTAIVMVIIQPETITGGLQRGINDLELYQQNPEQHSSWGVRINLWRVSLNIFQEHPLLGTGLGDFHTDNKRLVSDGVIKGVGIDQYGHAHSIYFEVLATTGLLGLFSMIAALLLIPFTFFYRYWKIETDDWSRFNALAGMMTILAFAVFGLTECWLSRNVFVNSYVFYVSIFAAALLVPTDRSKIAV